ncbi:MAG: DUF1028 domain-containing protein [Bacteroidota bacterium]
MLARVIGLVLLAVPLPAHATFSIVACEPETGICGVAVATHNLAVGASVPTLQAGVGAIVSQYETNPLYGPLALRLFAEQLSTPEVLERMLAQDGQFEGRGPEARQVGIVRADGSVAIHTGKAALASGWAGQRSGSGYAVLGNGLDGERVLLAMEQAFQSSRAPFSRRLVDALLAGQEAGGQTIGVLSAAVIVRTPDGWPRDIDLRVDAHDTPVHRLSALLDLHEARQVMIRAERLMRRGDTAAAWDAVALALHLGADWDRTWRRAARLAMTAGASERALDYLAVFMAHNPTWGLREIQDPLYAPLHGSPLFQRWLSAVAN